MAEIGKFIQMKTIWVEASGRRKAIGEKIFQPHPDFIGDVAEMEYEAGMALIRACEKNQEGELPNFRIAIPVNASDVESSEPEPELIVSAPIKRMGRPKRNV